MENIQEQLKEKFFTKTLSAEERALFVDQMATDKAFAEDIAIELQLRKTLIAKKQWTPNLPHSEKIKPDALKKTSPLFYYITAAVLLFGVGIWQFNRHKNEEKQALILIKNQKSDALKNKQAQYLRDSLLKDSLEKVALKKAPPSVSPDKNDPKNGQKPNNSIKDTVPKLPNVGVKKPTDIVENVNTPQVLNISVLSIARQRYSRTAGTSDTKLQETWLATFAALEKREFEGVTVVEITDLLREAQPTFDKATADNVSQTNLLKFVLLNMLVQPFNAQQKQNLEKWLINFIPTQYNVEQQKYWNEMRRMYLASR